ncbi:Uncharacterized protein Fot_07438 [Forsythia ovata]|uniref:Uncharacterized protein n=1 Tax=Forsythia ovata TaxID=205694 RepID=A0ABD1WVV4_9LAMI
MGNDLLPMVGYMGRSYKGHRTRATDILRQRGLRTQNIEYCVNGMHGQNCVRPEAEDFDIIGSTCSTGSTTLLNRKGHKQWPQSSASLDLGTTVFLLKRATLLALMTSSVRNPKQPT